jgi:S-adenosylmethionine:tRNA ribosyltransferase-isomerase
VTPDLQLSQFDYDLPEELIAQFPAQQRDASRLLHLSGKGELYDRQFKDLPALLNPGDLLVFNNTRVIKARLLGHKLSGGKVEVLVERITGSHTALAHVKASKSPKPGSALLLADTIEVMVEGRQDSLFVLSFPTPVLDVLQQHGSTPLPPYITHTPTQDDDERYQTVYADLPGAVAAPTAGLHFDQAMLDVLANQGVQQAFVTLHVGAGTFQPVRVQNLSNHVMHKEYFHVPDDVIHKIHATRHAGGRVIAVGTTSVRALESAAAQHTDPGQDRRGDTQLFITPGYVFAWVDALITNFHLPQSTLLMLVSALADQGSIQRAYAHAIAQRYRFFSYGDAMFIESTLNKQ